MADLGLTEEKPPSSPYINNMELITTIYGNGHSLDNFFFQKYGKKVKNSTSLPFL